MHPHQAVYGVSFTSGSQMEKSSFLIAKPGESEAEGLSKTLMCHCHFGKFSRNHEKILSVELRQESETIWQLELVSVDLINYSHNQPKTQPSPREISQ